jgi:hypothetical protein
MIKVNMMNGLEVFHVVGNQKRDYTKYWLKQLNETNHMIVGVDSRIILKQIFEN